MTKQPVTIRDVAALAGFSVSTVRNALSGQRSVSQETRTRVQAAARQLGYRPNNAAHSHRPGIRHAVGLIIPDANNPFFTEVAHGVETAAQALGWAVFLGNTERDQARETDYLNRLSVASDGIVFFPTSSRGDQVQRMVDGGVAVVVCDERIDVTGAGGVFSDNVAGGRLAAGHLLARGARWIAMINGPGELSTARERHAGFLAGLRAAGRSLPPSRLIGSRYTIDGGRQAADQLLAADPRIDAIFCANDLQAIGAAQALEQAGRKIPGDVLLCGFDGIGWGELTRPSLTTVARHSHRLGMDATRLLIRMVAHGAGPCEIVLPVCLTERESTGRG